MKLRPLQRPVFFPSRIPLARYECRATLDACGPIRDLSQTPNGSLLPMCTDRLSLSTLFFLQRCHFLPPIFSCQPTIFPNPYSLPRRARNQWSKAKKKHQNPFSLRFSQETCLPCKEESPTPPTAILTSLPECETAETAECAWNVRGETVETAGIC